MDRQRAMAREHWAGLRPAGAGRRVARAARPAGADGVHRLRPRRRRRRDSWRWSRMASRSTRREAGRHGPGPVRPHALLCRERRPGRRPGRGRLAAAAAATVTDVPRQAGDLHVHALTITDGPAGRRRARCSSASTPSAAPARALNHSAAHLAHAALRHVLGPHVAQKGQLVDADRMRFDFSHGAPLTADEIDAHRGRGERGDPPEPAADTREMAPAGGDRGRRHRPVRREVRRQRARADAWGGRSAGRAPIRSSCAAAPTWPAPATSRCSRSSPNRASPPACAASRP